MNPPSRGRRWPAGVSWSAYRQTIGDRSGMFAALMKTWAPAKALYPGCYLDLSASTTIPSVTYVDTDRRAARYFANQELVATELQAHSRNSVKTEVNFLHANYTTPLSLPKAEFDLLISLYAGPVWDHCHQYLKPNGLLLANTSHGDASLAALDSRLELVAAIHHRGDKYRIDRSALADYLTPKNPTAADPDLIRRNGRGIAYTRTAFAYLFKLT
ncbi:MAG: hypothetical protein ACPGVG_04690 [Mycobacterium sp.]